MRNPIFRRRLSRILAGCAAMLIALCCLIQLPARAAEQHNNTVLSEAQYSAGRRKTTPTPKPKKTPKPATAAPAAEPLPETTPAPAEEEAPKVTPTPVPEGPIIEPQAIADWLFAHDMTLPDNFITKKEAQNLGWGTRYRNVSDAAPGKSIGGDYFGNYQGLLPKAKGRTYYECDCYYVKGSRKAYRLVFSNDGLVFYTEDHYNTFVQLFPSDSPGGSAP